MSEPSLTDFLLARIAEDEAWRVTRLRRGYLPTPRECREADRWASECEAKRRIVALHDDWHVCPTGNGGDTDYSPAEDDGLRPCPTMLALAANYADHDAYRDEWRA